MNTDVAPFQGVMRCPKCACTNRIIRYCDGDIRFIETNGHRRANDCPQREHLIIECGVCGYQWNEEVRSH